MKKITLIFIFIFSSSYVQSQNICNILRDYKQTQEWITIVQKNDVLQRKDSILKLIKCNRNYINDKHNLQFMIVLDGSQSLLDDLTANRDTIFEKINPENFEILNSMCENKNFYPQKCELGTILIKTEKELIFNDIPTIDFIKINGSKKRIKILLRANSNSDATITIERFSDGANKTTKKLVLVKGKNTIDFSNTVDIKMVTIQKDTNKMIFKI